MDLHKLTLLICLASIESIYADVSDTELKSKMNALGIADEDSEPMIQIYTTYWTILENGKIKEH